MKLTLSKKDLFRLSEPTRAEILDYLSLRAPEEEPPADDPDQEYVGFDMTHVADLTYRQMWTWMEAASDWTKAGLKVFAEQGPIVHVGALVEALKNTTNGSDNYSQFQSRTTVRTRTVTGNREAYLLGWNNWDEEETQYAVTRQTYKSLRRYFRLDEGEAS